MTKMFLVSNYTSSLLTNNKYCGIKITRIQKKEVKKMGVGKGHRIIRMVDGGIRVEGILPDGVTIKDVNEVCISHFSNLSHGMRVNMVFKGDKFPKYGVLSCLSKEQAFVRVNSQ